MNESSVEFKKVGGNPIKFNFQLPNGLPVKTILTPPFDFVHSSKTNEYEKVYDIEVDIDHSFTANGCIVHNCQDISVAGVQKGIKKGTRSGLLFEVERIVEKIVVQDRIQ